MTRFPKPKDASRGTAPPQAPYANPDALDLPFVEVRAIVQKEKKIAGKEKICTFLYAVYDPPMNLLRAQFGPTCQTDGWEERCFPYDTRNNNPRFLVVWCRRVRLKVDGKLVSDLARPAGFNNGRRCHDDLEGVVREMLADSNVAQIRRVTGLSRPRIKAICGEMVEAYLDSLRDSDAAPLFIAIDVVDPGSRKGQKQRKSRSTPLLMVTGSDPRRGQNFFLGLFEMPPGGTKWRPQTPIVRALKDLLLALPFPEDLLGVALDGEGRLRSLMQAALDSAARQNPVFKQVRFGLDPWHAILNCAKALTAERNKLRREEGPDDEAFAKALWHANDLDQKHWNMIPPQRQKELKRLLGRAQELRDLHAILMAVRRLLRLPTRAAASEAWDALCAGLTKFQRARLQDFLTYFDMKEKTRRLCAMAMTSVAAAHRQVVLAPRTDSLAPEACDHKVAEYLDRIAPAYAARTISGLASDWRLFRGWCQREERLALPAACDTVAAYMAMLAATHAPGTIRRHLASLSHLHRAFGLPNPTDSPAVRLAWRAITRQKDIRPARQRTPLRRREIEALLAHLGSSLIDRRDHALLLVARDSLARRSELARLTVADITWQAAKEGAEILIRRAKNDAAGEGRLAWLAPGTRKALSDYLAAGRLSEGPLFRRVIAGERLGEGLRPQAMARRVKLLASRAGIDAENISAHSTRIGMTLDLVGAGQSLVAVQLAGGWQSPAMPALYARQLLPELGAVARYYGQLSQ